MEDEPERDDITVHCELHTLSHLESVRTESDGIASEEDDNDPGEVHGKIQIGENFQFIFCKK